MSGGCVGRNETPEKIKFLFLSNNRVSVCTQDALLNNYEFMLIPSDTKNGKNRGKFGNHG